MTNNRRYSFDTNWPLPDAHLLELGRMISVWGSLESILNLAISKLAGYDSPADVRAFILMAHATFQQRLDVVETLCEQLAATFPNLAGYKQVIDKIDAAKKGRNKYTHNSLGVSEQGNNVEVSYMSARGTLKANVETVRLNDLKEVTAKIHEATCALHSLITGVELKPLWERA